MYTERKFEDHIEARLIDSGYSSIHFEKYDRDLCLIQDEVLAFIKQTQPKAWKKYQNIYPDAAQDKLIKRISEEIGKGKEKDRGLIDVLREGIKDRGVSFDLIYFPPKSGLNPDHARLYKENRYVVMRQLHFSLKNEQSIDMAIFINGLPILTMELKNHFTGQDIKDSQKQYESRDHSEKIFHFKRCLVHFCCDNDEVSMSTRLGKKVRWLPYNKGIRNPIVEGDHISSYFWEEILQPESLLDIIENFSVISQEVKVKYDPKKRKVVEETEEVQYFPRYHQLDAIRRIRNTVIEDGPGRNFLIQHTTGAGKSLEIGWLAHILASLYRSKTDKERIYDSIIVLTDRRVLDKQLRNTIIKLEKRSGVTSPVTKDSKELKKFLEKGKDIIITTIQKFPVISGAIGELKGKNFAIIVDEVHSSQSGNTAKHVKKSLTKGVHELGEEEEEEYSDFDPKLLADIKARGRQKNISYFGFTGTPKNKTLELFGERMVEHGKVKYVPFHIYSMKQSIHEKFTLDVLRHYTTYERYFKLNKKLEDDPDVPKKKVMRQLVSYVDMQKETIQQKVQVILHHFVHNTAKKIEGQARAMVVARSRLHCVKFTLELKKQMKDMGLPYTCLGAFSGSVENPDNDKKYTEADINELEKGLSIPKAFKYPKYRILVVANKFQTGFDEPLLHTMFVDKKLSGLQCVQTLSRLNRSKGGKTDTFILDFVNKADDIQAAFQPYYQSTYLDGETDPNRLYELEREIKGYHLFTPVEQKEMISIFFDDNKKDEEFMHLIGYAVQRYDQIEETDKQDAFKSKVQSFLRMYAYVTQLGMEDPNLEELYIYLTYLNRKLPKEEEEQFADILNAVDLDSFRLEKKWQGDIRLEYEDGELQPMVAEEGGARYAPEIGPLSEIIEILNQTFGEQSEENLTHIKNTMKRAEENEDLRKQMTADNTERNKRDSFKKLIEEIWLGYVNDHFDFYKAVATGESKGELINLMYEEVKRRFGAGESPT